MKKLSFFADFFSKMPADVSLLQIVETIRTSAKLKSITDAYRATGRKDIKATSPLFAVACHFKNGKGKDDIDSLTGLGIVDIDHVDPAQLEAIKQKVEKDPHTLLCYVTISGEGLRIIFCYENDSTQPLHKQVQFYTKAYLACNQYYAQLLGVPSDEKCKNVTRLSGLAFCPTVFYREEAEPFTAEWILKESQTTLRHAKQRQKQRREMTRIQARYESIIQPEVEREGGVYAPGSHNNYVMRVGYKLNQFGFSFDSALEWALKQFPEYDGVEQVLRSCYESQRQEFASRGGSKRSYSYGSSGEGSASVTDIERFLSEHIKLRRNEITQRTEFLSDCKPEKNQFVWRNITDHTVNSLWKKMSALKRVNIADIYRVIDSDFVKNFNPFKEYLYALTEWKEGDTDYIQQLARTVTVKGGEDEQRLWHIYLKKWFVAMVAAWLDPEVVNNVILVLIGEQGAYKTTWFNYLLPAPLRQYFYTKTNANRMSKDDLLTLALYALVCCEELDTMRPSELNQLKATVTMPSINERAAYAHYHENRDHIASYAATGNNPQFLSDTTGNRRWLPFEVVHILSPREHPFPYKGIYAQALYLINNGFRYWFTKEEIQLLNRHNKKFETPHLEEELVDVYFRKPTNDEYGTFISVARAIEYMGTYAAQKLDPVRVGKAFRTLGFEAVRTKKYRGFIVILRESKDIKGYLHALAQEAQAEEPE